MPYKPASIFQHRNEVQVRARDRWRGSAAERGYDNEWRKYSKWRLSQHPTCEDCKCKGLIVPATLTGHIKPASYFPELFHDPSNHISQCVQCNAVQSIADERRYGSKIKSEGPRK